MLILALPAAVRAQVSGQVLALDGRPLAGARVRIQTHELFVLSRSDGGFDLPDGAGQVMVTAGLEGHYVGGSVVIAPATGVIIRLEPIPPDDPSYTFLSAATCGHSVCHFDYRSEWLPSAMHNANLNTWVFDLFDGSGTPQGANGFVYTRDSAHRFLRPYGECSGCHAPLRHLAAGGATTLGDLDHITPEMLEGITCDLCHKIGAVDPAKLDDPGVVPEQLTLVRPTSGPLAFGPFDDVTFVSGPMRAAYNAAAFGDDLLCAACHEDNHDHDDDGEFDDPGSVPSEATYSEWLASPYAQPGPGYRNCSDCHMPSDGDTSFCILEPLERDPARLRSHRFEGTTPIYLQNALELSWTPLLASRRALSFRISVTNTGAGHKVPSGVTVRNVLLLVEVRERDSGRPLKFIGGATVPFYGGSDGPSRGGFAGLPGTGFAVVHGDAEGNVTPFYTESTQILSDTRIPPLATATSRYQYRMGPEAGAVVVSAKLLYRRAWHDLEVTKNWVNTGHGAPNVDLIGPDFGFVMAQRSWTVEIPH